MKIEVKNVNKKFGHVTALKDVSVTFETGKIYKQSLSVESRWQHHSIDYGK